MSVLISQKTDTDCLRACMATLLERPYEDVPDFGPTVGQWRRLERYLAPDHLQPLGMPPGRFCCPYNAYYLVWGTSERGLRHSVIGLNGTMAHDPHPSRAGLETIEQYVIFVAFLHDVK